VVGLVFALTFLVWWTDMVRVPELATYDDEPVTFVAAPIWGRLYYPILISLLSSVAIYLIDLVRPWRSLAVSMVDIAIGIANIAIVTIILRTGRLIDVVVRPEHAEQAARAQYFVNGAIFWTFVIIGVVTAFQVLSELWRIVKTRQPRATPVIAM
jgi:hypothetical protein